MAGGREAASRGDTKGHLLQPLQGRAKQGTGQVWGEAHLLFEVADGVLISVGEEVQDVVFDVILLQVVHEMRPIAL